MAFDFGKMMSGVPIIGGAFDDSDEKAIAELMGNKDIWRNLELPEFTDYVPEEFSYVGDYLPEEAQATRIEEDPVLRARQLAALEELSGLSDTGLSELDELGFYEAQALGAQQARAGAEAAIQDAQARGVSGGGMEFALREMANQGGANRTAAGAREQAAKAAEMRALYQQAYGDALSGMRGQDLAANTANANILNQFNMANTQNRNAAQQRNLDTRQGISHANTQNRNDAQQYNNSMAQQQYQNRVTKAQGQSGANTGVAQGYAAQNAANTDSRNKNTELVGKALGLF